MANESKGICQAYCVNRLSVTDYLKGEVGGGGGKTPPPPPPHPALGGGGGGGAEPPQYSRSARRSCAVEGSKVLVHVFCGFSVRNTARPMGQRLDVRWGSLDWTPTQLIPGHPEQRSTKEAGRVCFNCDIPNQRNYRRCVALLQALLETLLQ